MINISINNIILNIGINFLHAATVFQEPYASEKTKLIDQTKYAEFLDKSQEYISELDGIKHTIIFNIIQTNIFTGKLKEILEKIMNRDFNVTDSKKREVFGNTIVQTDIDAEIIKTKQEYSKQKGTGDIEKALNSFNAEFQNMLKNQDLYCLIKNDFDEMLQKTSTGANNWKTEVTTKLEELYAAKSNTQNPDLGKNKIIIDEINVKLKARKKTEIEENKLLQYEIKAGTIADLINKQISDISTLDMILEECKKIPAPTPTQLPQQTPPQQGTQQPESPTSPKQNATEATSPKKANTIWDFLQSPGFLCGTGGLVILGGILIVTKEQKAKNTQKTTSQKQNTSINPKSTTQNK